MILHGFFGHEIKKTACLMGLPGKLFRKGKALKTV